VRSAAAVRTGMPVGLGSMRFTVKALSDSDKAACSRRLRDDDAVAAIGKCEVDGVDDPHEVTSSAPAEAGNTAAPVAAVAAAPVVAAAAAPVSVVAAAPVAAAAAASSALGGAGLRALVPPAAPPLDGSFLHNTGRRISIVSTCPVVFVLFASAASILIVNMLRKWLGNALQVLGHHAHAK